MPLSLLLLHTRFSLHIRELTESLSWVAVLAVTVGVLVFEGLGLLFVLLALSLLSGGWWLDGVVIQVPCRQGQVPVEGWAVDVVVAAYAVR